MTRILSDILQAPEPSFQQQLRHLERVGGHENIDIKLSVEVTQAARQKIHQLGLDKRDTTTQELYQALLARVSADDARLERTLRTVAAAHVSAEADLLAGLLHVLQRDAAAVQTYGLKPAAAKRLLRQHQPKRLMKQLGYRSLDALLRREQPFALVAAAQVIESAAWRRSWLDGYKKLAAADFERRPVLVVSTTSERWQSAVDAILADQACTVIGQAELGSIVVLPLPAVRPAGLVVASLATALHELNTVSAAGTFLQASQAQADFGGRVRQVAAQTVTVAAPAITPHVSWQLVQRYYAGLRGHINEDIFGPFVQAEDFSWQTVTKRLAELCPSLEFWQSIEHVSFLHEGAAVSLNVLDAAINCCNAANYELRQLGHAQEALWHELTLRYLQQDHLEQAIAAVLRPQLAAEIA